MSDPNQLLWQAMYKNDQEAMLTLLRSGGADPNHVDADETASRLSWALRTPNFRMAQLLVDYGADVEARYDDGWSVLHNAAENDELEQVRWLVAVAGADVDARTDGHLMTPLMCAGKNTDVARFLLACRADVNLVDSEGMTALELTDVDAYDEDDHSCAALLYAAGATQRTFSVSPLDLEPAIEAGRRAVAHEQIALIRRRASEICIALQSLGLPAWVTLQVLEFACEPLACCVRLGAKWALVTKVKHFNQQK
jgi:ankyrin repeat protein